MANLYKHPVKFLKNQIQKEFFGFLGFWFTIGIMLYGIKTEKSLSVATFSLTSTPTNYSTIPLSIIGFLGALAIVIYLYKKRRK